MRALSRYLFISFIVYSNMLFLMSGFLFRLTMSFLYRNFTLPKYLWINYSSSWSWIHRPSFPYQRRNFYCWRLRKGRVNKLTSHSFLTHGENQIGFYWMSTITQNIFHLWRYRRKRCKILFWKSLVVQLHNEQNLW